MFSLLDPRLWLAGLAIVLAASIGSYFKGRSDGSQICEARHAKATVLANNEARALEQARQRRADEAAKLGAAREARIRADAASAARAASGLRDDLRAVELHAATSRAAADNAVRALSDVFGSCVAAYSELAAEADRAHSEALTLRQAWPR